MQSDQLNNFQKPELERSILSSLMVDPDEFFRHEIPSEIFTEKRKTVFETIKSLIESGVKPDLLTVKNDINDKDFIQELVSIASAPVSVNPDYYIQELKTARKRHDLYDTLTLTRDMCLNGLKLEDIESKLRTNIASAETHEPQKTLDILTRLIDEIEKEATGQVEKGVKTGIQTLDYMTNGFSPGDIVTIAARPGMGKSSLAMNMVRNFSFFDVPGMVFSLEMKADALMRRMICDIGGVDSCYLFQNQLRKDKSMWQYINDATSKMSQFPIAWDDSSGLTIDRIVSRARKQKALHGLSYGVIDYVQLINGWNKDGQGPKAEIYSQLKSSSKELDIFWIVLSQMNREIEKRNKKKPQMSDLRDAGCLSGDTKIYLDGKIVEIKDCIGLSCNDKKTMVYDGQSTKNLTFKKIFHNGFKETILVETTTGHRIKATKDHRILTSEGWREVRDLNDKSLLAVPLSFNYDIETKRTRPLNEARIIAMMIANGCVLNNRTPYYTSHSEDIDLCQTLIDDVECFSGGFIKPRLKKQFFRDETSSCLNVYLTSIATPGKRRGNFIIDYFKSIGIFGKRANVKKIPDFVFLENESFKKETIKYLFSTDGCICVSRGKKTVVSISYTSKSFDLISGLQLLLQSVGILSTVRAVESKGFSWYCLNIYSAYFLKKFMVEIGFAGKRKNKIAEDAMCVLKNKKSGWTKYKLSENNKMAYVPVKNIKTNGFENVYDMEVPEHHNFVANGIVVHNCIEQDSTHIIFPVIDSKAAGKPRITEGNDNESAVLYLEKNRNGRTGQISSMRWQGHLFRFFDNYGL